VTRVRVDRLLQAGERVSLEGSARHHLVVVLRAKLGDHVTLVDVAGVRWSGRIVEVAPLGIEVLKVDDSPSANPVGHLEVWVPLLKGGRTDDLVRQLTELGAGSLRCYVASRSVARLEPSKIDKRVGRWQTIAAEATRQCGRTDVPIVSFSRSLPERGPGVYFWEEGGAPAATALSEGVQGGGVSLLIGPEGGLDRTEASHLDEVGWVAASLGARVLRAETAVVAAATLGLVALREGGYADVV
jgi:16S rRNA (uracil1498-N3)-methyltransferase